MKLENTTAFFTLPYDTRTALIEVKKAFRAMAEVRQWWVKNVFDKNNFCATKLKATESKHVTTAASAQSAHFKEGIEEELESTG